MSKVEIIKLITPDKFLGIDLALKQLIVDKIEEIMDSKLTSPLEITLNKIYFVNVHRKLYRARPFMNENPINYKCILIDEGKIEVVQKQNFYNLFNNEVITGYPAAKIFKVVGLKPTQMFISEFGPLRKAEVKEGKQWERRSYKFSGFLFGKNPFIKVHYIKEGQDKAYVKANVMYDGKLWDYSDLLVQQQHAVLSHDMNLDELGNGIEYEGISESISNDSISDLLIDSKKIDNLEDVKNVSDFMESKLVIKDNQNKSFKSLKPNSNDAMSSSVRQSYLSDLERLVKRWYVWKEKGEKITYHYRKPIAPIVSYQQDKHISGFIKSAMDFYKSRTLLNVQAYMIPAILRGINTLAIAPKDKGKSMGILIPVLQSVAEKNLDRGTEFNPLAVIICTSWKSVKNMTDSSRKLMKFFPENEKRKKPKIVSCYAGELEKKAMMTILNGCDILVITPSSLLRLLKSHAVFKFDCLKFLCFDDIEVLISNHLEELKEILFYKQTATIERGYAAQVILTATHWTSGVESFVKNAIGDKFSVIVNDPLEIAVFERLNQTIIECEDFSNAFKQIQDYLKLTESSLKRTVIFTTDDNRLLLLYRYLMNNTDYDLRTMKGSMTSQELKHVELEWKQFRGLVKMPLLIISDEVLGRNEVTITEAQSLFHLDVDKSKFSSRLNCLHDKFEKLTFFTDECGKPSNDRMCYSYMFLCPDRMTLSDCNFIYKFLGRCNVMRPAWLCEKAIDYVLKKEKSKGTNDLCPRIKKYGECKLPGCDKRHLIKYDVDRPILPNKGKIKFRILHWESPSHFYVRIIEHLTLDNSESTYNPEYRRVKMKMLSYFNNQHNIHGVNPRYIKPGLIAAIKKNDLTERVLVIDDNQTKRKKQGFVSVRLIDIGEVRQVEESELLQLSQELIEIPAQAIEAYLIGVRPLDCDESYPEEAKKYATSFVQGDDLHALIMMCIGSTLWLDTVVRKFHLPISKTSIWDKNLSLELISQNFAEKNPGHMQKLVRLCAGKIDIWKPIIRPEDDTPLMKKFSYDTKALVFEELCVKEIDECSSTTCLYSTVYSPQLMFFTCNTNINSIYRMEAEINELIQSIEVLPRNNVKPGCRLLYQRDGQWMRGYVLSVADAYTIFSLDWGFTDVLDFNNELKKLPTQYQEMAYQAMLCSLQYCQHNKQSYSHDVNDAIINFGTEFNKKRVLLSLTCYTKCNMDSKTFINLINGHVDDNLDIFNHLKLHSVEIFKKNNKVDVALHEVLIRNQNILPNMEWLVEILPESKRQVSRIYRKNSIPHITADILFSKDSKIRMEYAEMIEEIILNKCQTFNETGKVLAVVEDILNSLIILFHFVSDRNMFMSLIRSFLHLIKLTQVATLELEPTEFSKSLSSKVFDMQYVSKVVVSYHSAVFHLLRLLNIVVRQNQSDDVAQIVDIFYYLLNNTEIIQDLLNEENWYTVLASCIHVLGYCVHPTYERLMTILVQLASLHPSNNDFSSQTDSNQQLAGILQQACQVLLETSTTSSCTWECSLSLICVLVGHKQYWAMIKKMNLFGKLMDRVLIHQNREDWNSTLDEAEELLTILWRSGLYRSSNCDSDAKLKNEELADRVQKACEADSKVMNALGSLLSELRLENSRMLNQEIKSNEVCSNFPDEDAELWEQGWDSELARKQKISYNRVFQDADFEDCKNDLEMEGDDLSTDNSDEENSDVPIDSFLSTNNPADEDNVHCFDRS